MVFSSEATPPSLPPSKSVKAPTSPLLPPSPKMSPRIRSQSAAPARKSSRDGRRRGARNAQPQSDSGILNVTSPASHHAGEITSWPTKNETIPQAHQPPQAATSIHPLRPKATLPAAHKPHAILAAIIRLTLGPAKKAAGTCAHSIAATRALKNVPGKPAAPTKK